MIESISFYCVLIIALALSISLTQLAGLFLRPADRTAAAAPN